MAVQGESKILLNRRLKLQMALQSDFYCPRVWSDENMGTAQPGNDERSTPPTHYGEFKLVDADMFGDGVRSAGVVKSNFAICCDSQTEECTKVSKSAVDDASMDVVGEVEDDEKGIMNKTLKLEDAVEVEVCKTTNTEETTKLDGKALLKDISTNTSQSLLADAATGNSQAEFVECGTGSSQPYLIDCGVQTSQDFFLKQDAATVEKPSLPPTIETRQTLQPNKAINQMNNPKNSLSIYSAPHSSDLTFDFDEADKENVVYMEHSKARKRRNVQDLFETEEETLKENYLPALVAPTFSRNPFVRVGLSKKSAKRSRHVLHPLRSIQDNEVLKS